MTATEELIDRIPDMTTEDIRAIYLTIGYYPRRVIRAAGDELRARRTNATPAGNPDKLHGSGTGLTAPYRYLGR